MSSLRTAMPATRTARAASPKSAKSAKGCGCAFGMLQVLILAEPIL